MEMLARRRIVFKYKVFMTNEKPPREQWRIWSDTCIRDSTPHYVSVRLHLMQRLAEKNTITYFYFMTVFNARFRLMNQGASQYGVTQRTLMSERVSGEGMTANTKLLEDNLFWNTCRNKLHVVRMKDICCTKNITTNDVNNSSAVSTWSSWSEEILRK